ncbi:MAG: hypothetical protein JWO95_1540 [Verrucomicrobiales bacterium]|nr:hypothetical protein [Verrucomicrobiales bacterium]
MESGSSGLRKGDDIDGACTMERRSKRQSSRWRHACAAGFFWAEGKGLAGKKQLMRTGVDEAHAVEQPGAFDASRVKGLLIRMEPRWRAAGVKGRRPGDSGDGVARRRPLGKRPAACAPVGQTRAAAGRRAGERSGGRAPVARTFARCEGAGAHTGKGRDAGARPERSERDQARKGRREQRADGARRLQPGGGPRAGSKGERRRTKRQRGHCDVGQPERSS